MISRDYSQDVEECFDFCKLRISTIKPSDWTEQNRSMDSSVSRFEGKFSYKVTPYTREIVDCMAPDHPARIIAIMKGAQVGFSTGVIEPGVGWIISQNPGNILFLTGHGDLSEEAIVKIDNMIDSCGIRNMIRPSIQRKKSSKTGDTNSKKEFPGGALVSGSAGNHKMLRQRSVRYGFIDDFEAAKNNTKESGSTRKMIEQRFAAYYDMMKLFYISTPELDRTSNIKPVYLQGDQRKFFIPCPCCGEYINLEWSIPVENADNEMGGITWKLDSNNKLIDSSVGYICQKCGGFFTDQNKYELNLAGFWKPTAIPDQPDIYSYHLSSLYAPVGMYDWRHYVNDWLDAHPIGAKRKEHLYKAFVNLVLGETYEETGEAPEANILQKNTRNYEPGTVPEKQSIADGNGRIVLLTCAVDMNGKDADARLDWEIVGWSETGSSYSVQHGSIGTFIRKEGDLKVKEDRARWTYEHNKTNSVWPELLKVIQAEYPTDSGKKMRIPLTGLDCGHFTTFAYAFVDKNPSCVVGLKGKDTEKFIKIGIDVPSFKQAQERDNLFLVYVNQIKDEIAGLMKLNYDPRTDTMQPPGFMNYPTPTKGMYTYNSFFSHYEGEHKVVEQKDGEEVAATWKKKSSTHNNHFWDCRVYNHAVKDLVVYIIGREYKLKVFTWADYVKLTAPK